MRTTNNLCYSFVRAFSIVAETRHFPARTNGAKIRDLWPKEIGRSEAQREFVSHRNLTLEVGWWAKTLTDRSVMWAALFFCHPKWQKFARNSSPGRQRRKWNQEYPSSAVPNSALLQIFRATLHLRPLTKNWRKLVKVETSAAVISANKYTIASEWPDLKELSCGSWTANLVSRLAAIHVH